MYKNPTQKHTRRIDVMLTQDEMKLLEMLIKHYNKTFPYPMNLSDAVRYCILQEGNALMLRLEGRKNG